jgi:predicted phage replisome organizer
MSDTHKYFWLKLKRDFFKRHDITIIEAMPNGKDYILFYMKLLAESVDHEGSLRFSETIPYNEDMLATITRTNVDIVRTAVKIFSELGMMERLDDGTLFMAQVQSMIGSETSDAIRKREYREKSKQVDTVQEQEGQCPIVSQKRAPELEIELDKEIEKDTQEAGLSVLPSIKYPTGYPRMLFDKWQAIPGAIPTRDYFNWLQTDFREISSAIAGIDSAIVLKSLDNYKYVRENPKDTWMTANPSMRKFFTGEMFGQCRPEVFSANGKPKDVPRCKGCGCQLAPNGKYEGRCINEECSEYKKEAI